ncbi:MAG TPA: hypothetical protein DCY97_09220 [Marinilabiliales bacterium]|nr:hypothetical protein [Marinilabiliales bacterium]
MKTNFTIDEINTNRKCYRQAKRTEWLLNKKDFFAPAAYTHLQKPARPSLRQFLQKSVSTRL